MEVETKIKTLEEIYRPMAVNEDLGISDKGSVHAYIPEYERLLAPYRDLPITFMEIGVNQGHSIKMWREYFTKARIIGVDIWCGSGEYIKDLDVEFICSDATFKSFGDGITYGLDVVCDDGAHFESIQLQTYDLLKDKMNKGGIYIIEDILNPEQTCPKFRELGFEIIDLREKKGRFDDCLCIKYF